MKTINITFEDEEFKELVTLKNGDSWHDFIIKFSKLSGEKDVESI